MNQSRIISAALTLFAAAVVASPVVAQVKEKPVLCAVVQIDGEYQVVLKASLASLKKRLVQEHKEAVAAHKQAAKDARKQKQKFKEPAPKAKKLKVLKGSIEQSKANALVETLKEKARKKLERSAKSGGARSGSRGK